MTLHSYIQPCLFDEEVAESPSFLSEQIITYIGNKRSLLGFLDKAISIVQTELGRDKLDLVDVFSGSGIVARYFKRFASSLYANDQERYCRTINSCYLANQSQIDMGNLRTTYARLMDGLVDERLSSGFISELYAPRDDQNIQPGERVFFTTRNAMYIDTARRLIGELDPVLRPFFLAPLIYEASVHNNTSGVFKGFYKNSETGIGQFGGNGRNALKRILGNISLPFPVCSRFECDVHVLQMDANELWRHLPEIDLAYIDPPYNQHPYGSNYFMLNLIDTYEKPTTISGVSGIPVGWNKSKYNVRSEAKSSLFDLCRRIPAKYLLISFNSEGFIDSCEMVEMLKSIGHVRTMETPYNTFRGSRNLSSRDIHVTEFLYLVKKYY